MDRDGDGVATFAHGHVHEVREWDAGPDGLRGTSDDGKCHLVVAVCLDVDDARTLYGPLDR
jgi:hypothetical protein